MDDPSMNSFNHYAYGAVAEWLYRYAAGIDEDASGPGFRSIVLHPQFGADLGEVDATYESDHGPVGSNWRVAGGTVTWNVVIPANTTAVLYFPASVDKARLLENGKGIDASEGLKFVRTEANSTVYHAGAGTYSFRFAK
jgi:alpha-L-rhamnosidase